MKNKNNKTDKGALRPTKPEPISDQEISQAQKGPEGKDGKRK